MGLPGLPWTRYGHLLDQVNEYDLLVDRLICAETKRLAEQDDNYFVFEELIKQTLLAWTRDITICTEMHGVR